MGLSFEERLAQSELLHLRVRSFAAACLERGSFQRGGSSPSQSLVELACAIAHFQTGKDYHDLSDVVSRAVPADCFKFGRIFQFPVHEATCAFRTSGTTAANTGVHFMRDAATYHQLSLGWGQLALGLERSSAPIIVALAPWTGRGTVSSLGYMMQRMMEAFDGRSLRDERCESEFELDDPLRWLVSERGIDVSGLRRVAEVAHRTQSRVVLLATSFALVELVDALGQSTLPLPSGSTVMPTGGFKGRTRTIEPAVMGRELCRIFGDIDLVGEYGMTELTSQLYEGTRRAGPLCGEPGIYLEPPWLRVIPCAPGALEPVAEGEVGLACFVDLGNIDSAVALLTQDLVRREGNGVRLLGRQPSASVRGCSLAVEALLHPENRVNSKAARSMRRERQQAATAVPSDVEASRSRVRKLVTAAGVCKRKLLRDEAVLGRLAASSSMSVSGVKLAIDLALETEPTLDEVEQLVARATAGHSEADERSTVWVVLSSTVFTAAHRAAALALSISPRVKLRPSRRQPHFAQALADASQGLFEIVDELAPVTGDTVMVFGSNETVEAVHTSLPSGVAVLGYGHGMGVALVLAGADLASSAKGMALDILLFEQQGCLSPRLVLVDESCDTPQFINLLARELLAWNRVVPLESQSDEYLALAAWERRLAQTFSVVTPCGPGWIAEYSEQWCLEHRLPLSRTPRTISLIKSKQPLGLLEPIAALVTCVGFAGEGGVSEELARLLPKARRVPLGMMQRPRFDGPVDLR